eukprot:TRINITY_DN5762_c0_g1_i1.p1 TRINITY_DN5762_c0_g1~~TRINITY_DN5762_c0_g1_i1.p1  ORF type:complete len:223 (-),score=39.03 TRINITY_DN5762_c0_g1_i1:57-641(-)
MANSLARIEFFYDTVSPWSYIAYELLSRYHQCYPNRFSLELRPFYLGGVMKLSGNNPPGSIPAKGAYMMKDLERTAKYIGLGGGPIKLPSAFPVNTIFAQRLLLVVSHRQPQLVGPLSQRLWNAYWQRDIDISKPENIAKICAEVGMNGEQFNEFAEEAKTSAAIKVVFRIAYRHIGFGLTETTDCNGFCQLSQ